MNRFVRTLLIALTVLGLVTPVHDSLAQALDCGADDRECLESSYQLACNATEMRDSHGESCLVWVQRLREHSLASSPYWLAMAALGYARVADHAPSQEDAEQYTAQSRALLQQVVSTWPNTWYAAQAFTLLSALASSAGDIEGSISYMRDAMRADPDDAYTPWSLARKLARRAGASGLSEDYLEAADMFRTAYRMNEQSWYRAVNALRLYDVAGDTDEAERFRAEVASDSGMIDFADEVVADRFAHDLERAAEILGTACHSYIVPIFGSDTCAGGIDTLVEATRTVVSLAEREAIAEVAVEAMRRLMVADGVTEDQRSRFSQEFGMVQREWIDGGVQTAAVFLHYSNLVGDAELSLWALENAVELEPDNGLYRYWLGSRYLDFGRFDEALEHLQRARPDLPENFRLESLDLRIQRAEAGRATGQPR